jgi:hypothetical protein
VGSAASSKGGCRDIQGDKPNESLQPNGAALTPGWDSGARGGGPGG